MNKEILEKIKNIFEQMSYLKYTCHIDSLVRIDKERYGCDRCVLADTLDVERDRLICPLEVKADVYLLR